MKSENEGILYITSTAVNGLIKIGQTGNFEKRMDDLERNGYRNVTSLKRQFAIKVKNYVEKEAMIHKIFEKSRVADTELFAVDLDLAIQLLSALDGEKIYPQNEEKENIFVESAESSILPDGKYSLSNKEITVNAEIKNSSWTLLKGSEISITSNRSEKIPKKAQEIRAKLNIDEQGVLLENINIDRCSPSCVAFVAVNHRANGWVMWKDANGNNIDIYRQRAQTEE